jgi:hypothetical protein
LRPSIIEGERDEVRLAESLVLKLSHFLAPVLPKRFHVNPAPKIAQVLVDAVVTAEPVSQSVAKYDPAKSPSQERTFDI